MPAAVFGKRVLRVVICTLVFVAIWECCARFKDWSERGIPPLAMHYISPATYTYDAGGLHGIPSAVDGKYRMNALGFRGPEISLDKPVVLCLGASETYGIYESADNEYPRQLERTLATRHVHAQVVNGALPGARPEDTERTLRRVLPELRPRLVTLYFSPGAIVWTKSEWAHMHRSFASRNPPEEATGHLRIARRVHDLVLSNLPEAIRRRQADATLQQAIARAHVTPAARLPDKNFAEFRTELDAMVSELVAHHVAVVLITHADRFGSGALTSDNDVAEVRSFQTFYPKLTPAGLADSERRMNAIIASEAALHHAGLVDAARAIAPGPGNFADFFHFTDQGSARMAELLADRIKPTVQTARPAWR